MSKTNPCRNYRYETEHFILRQVRSEDAPALMACYSDPEAVARMNDDNCLRGFLCQTEEDLRAYIAVWQSEDYARPAVIDKSTGEAVGTLEIFGGGIGVLRVDLPTRYESPAVLQELYTLAMEKFPADFPMGAMVTKAPAGAPARRAVLKELGFAGPEEFRGYGDYYRLDCRKLGIAYCGLACCLCSENQSCPGCGQADTPCFETCENFPCAREKGLAGCWECKEFPCGKGMHGSNPRARAFVEFAREYGPEKLIECLERNHRAGVAYHYPGKLTGDYDGRSREEIFELLLNGRREK